MNEIEGVTAVAASKNLRGRQKSRRNAAKQTLMIALAVAQQPMDKQTIKKALNTGQVSSMVKAASQVLAANHRRQNSHRAHNRPHASQTVHHAHKELSDDPTHDGFYQRTKRPMKDTVNNDVAMAV